MVQPLTRSNVPLQTGATQFSQRPVIRKPELDAAATAMGLNYSDVVAAIGNGQSITDLATTKGIAVTTVETAILAPTTTALESQLKAGAITQAAHDQLLAQAQSHVAAVVGWSAGNGANNQGATLQAALAGLTSPDTSSAGSNLFQPFLGGSSATGFIDPLLTPTVQEASPSLLGYTSTGEAAVTPSSLMSLLQQLDTQA